MLPLSGKRSRRGGLPVICRRTAFRRRATSKRSRASPGPITCRLASRGNCVSITVAIGIAIPIALADDCADRRSASHER